MKIHRLSYCALASMLLLASCQEDDARDEVQPTVSITAPEARAKVWLETSLKVDAVDEQGVSKVMFYLDDELVGEDAEAPYELMLDTKQYEDGTYTLRTVAYDGSDNQTEAEREIEIFNSLLRVEVEDGRIDEASAEYSEREWIFISDSEGNVLETKEVVNGEVLNFSRPDGFTDKQITVTRANVYEDKEGESHRLRFYSYTGIAPDNWVLQDLGVEDSDAPSPAGQVTGSFMSPSYDVKIVTSERSFVYPTYSSSDSNDSIKVDFEADLYQDKVHLYVTTVPHEGEAPRYIYRDVEVGNNYDFAQSDFARMKVDKEISMPSSKIAYLDIYGYLDNDRDIPISRSGRLENVSSLPVYMPDYEFKQLGADFSSTNGKVTYQQNDIERVPDSYDVPTVSYVTTDTRLANFSVSVDYAHDYSSIFAYDWNEESSVMWLVYGSGQEVRFSAALPEEITREYPQLASKATSLSATSVSLYDRDDIDSYAAYADGLYKRESNWSVRTWKSVRIDLENDAENGRLATEKLPESLQAELKRHAEEHGLREWDIK